MAVTGLFILALIAFLHFAQAILMYAVMGLTAVLTFVVAGSGSQVADAAGEVWRTANIAESMATVSIFTMIFAVAMSVVKLVQAPAAATETSVDEATPVVVAALTEG